MKKPSFHIGLKTDKVRPHEEMVLQMAADAKRHRGEQPLRSAATSHPPTLYAPLLLCIFV